MGNCQAAEAATVLIQHPGGKKTERIYKSVSAKEVMNSNPGHYVALIVTSSSARSENGAPLKQLKLLRPDDTLHIGQVYRLVSFEEVLKEFAAKKCVKLGKLLLKEKLGNGEEKRKLFHRRIEGDSKKQASSKMENSSSVKVEEQQEIHELVGGNSSSSSNSSNNGRGVGIRQHQYQWRPALESISEIGT